VPASALAYPGSSSSSSSIVPSRPVDTTPNNATSPQLHQLVGRLLSWPRTPAVLATAAAAAAAAAATGTSSSSSGGGGGGGVGGAGAFSRLMSEREWLKGANRSWEAVQGSSELLQYYGAAAAARYAGAGGWRQR
jgi:hypothetical protein